MRLTKGMLDEMKKELDEVIKKNRDPAGSPSSAQAKGVSPQQTSDQEADASSPKIAGDSQPFASKGAAVTCDQANKIGDDKGS